MILLKTKQFFICTFLGFALSSCAQSYSEKEDDSSEFILEEQQSNLFLTERKVEFEKQKVKAKNFLSTHKSYNQELIFLLDMRLPS
ncbi:MAG: hypothetical protein COA33_012975 [Fluviicola sp.]|nr:hypothetical protein [Fluviicola sp.]